MRTVVVAGLVTLLAVALSSCGVSRSGTPFPDRPSVGISSRLQPRGSEDALPSVATCIDSKDVDPTVRSAISQAAAAALDRIARGEYDALWGELYRPGESPGLRDAFQVTASRLNERLRASGKIEQVDLRVIRFDGAYRGPVICGAIDTADPAHLSVLATSISGEVAFTRFQDGQSGDDLLVWLAFNDHGTWQVAFFGEAGHWLSQSSRSD